MNFYLRFCSIVVAYSNINNFVSKWKNHLIVAQERLAGFDVNEIQTKDLEEVATRRKTLSHFYLDEIDHAQNGAGFGEAPRSESPTGFVDIAAATATMTIDAPIAEPKVKVDAPAVETRKEPSQPAQPTTSDASRGSALRANSSRPVPRKTATRFTLPAPKVEDSTQTDDEKVEDSGSNMPTIMDSPVSESFSQASQPGPEHLGIDCDGCKVGT